MRVTDFHGASGVAFIAGTALHMLAFRVGEWDRETTRLVMTGFAINLTATVGLARLMPDAYTSIFAAAQDVAQLSFFVILGLYSSILVYRAFFHRLNGFPGPFAARLSNFYPTYLSTKNMHLYEEVQNLHKQYGDFVRLGPTELSVIHPQASAIVHSNTSPCVKGPWYNVQYPLISLHTCRDKAEHSRRRKVWDRGFTPKALRDYEPRVAKYTEQLMDAIAKHEGQPIDMSEWFNFYSFDVMGDLSFGQSFKMLYNGTEHYFMKTLHKHMHSIGVLSHMLWLFPILMSTPFLNSEHNKFFGWIGDRVQKRRQMKPDMPDVLSWILEDYESKGKMSKQEQLNLLGDASLIVVAGSDTTAATLTCIFYQLVMHPECLKALQEEVDQYHSINTTFESTSLAKLLYLDAVVNESLRLHPAVPSGVQRVTPPEGLRIGEQYIPGDTIIQIPLHTIMRDERNFAQPNDFIPERWTTKENLLKNQSNFLPFSSGRYSCVGKGLALMEVRRVTAQIVQKYDVSLAPEQTSESFLGGKQDAFTLALGPLKLVFKSRA